MKMRNFLSTVRPTVHTEHRAFRKPFQFSVYGTWRYDNHVISVPARRFPQSHQVLGSFSIRDDGDAEEDALWKKYLYFTLECLNCLDLLSSPIGLKSCSG